MNGKFVLGRRLSLIKDSVAVIMTYPQRAGMQVRLEMDCKEQRPDGGGDGMVEQMKTEF